MRHQDFKYTWMRYGRKKVENRWSDFTNNFLLLNHRTALKRTLNTIIVLYIQLLVTKHTVKTSSGKSDLFSYIARSIKNNAKNIPTSIAEVETEVVPFLWKNGPFVCPKRNVQIISRSARCTVTPTTLESLAIFT